MLRFTIGFDGAQHTDRRLKGRMLLLTALRQRATRQGRSDPPLRAEQRPASAAEGKL